MQLSDTLILIRGGGDLAPGVAHRLHCAGFTLLAFSYVWLYTYGWRLR